MQVPPITLIKSCTALVNVQLLTGLSKDWRINYVYGRFSAKRTGSDSGTTTTASVHTTTPTTKATCTTTDAADEQ
jgi:hypothetical protein